MSKERKQFISNIQEEKILKIVNLNSNDQKLLLKEAIIAGELIDVEQIIISSDVSDIELIENIFQNANQESFKNVTHIKVQIDGTEIILWTLEVNNDYDSNINDNMLISLVEALERGVFPKLSSLDLRASKVSAKMKLKILEALETYDLTLLQLNNITVDDHMNDQFKIAEKLTHHISKELLNFIRLKNINTSDNEYPNLATIHNKVGRETIHIYSHFYCRDSFNMFLYEMAMLKAFLAPEELNNKLLEFTNNTLMGYAISGRDKEVKYILNNPDKFPFSLNYLNDQNRSLISFERYNESMQKFVFSKGFAPFEKQKDKIEDNTKAIANDDQSSHGNKVIEKKKQWVLKELYHKFIKSDNDETNYPIDKVKDLTANFSQEITSIFANKNNKKLIISLANTSESSREEFFAFPKKAASDRPGKLSSFNNIIKNKTDQEYIDYIINTAVKALNNKYLTTNSKGDFTGDATGVVSCFPHDNKNQSEDIITIPLMLAIIKEKFVNVKPTLAQKIELAVTLFNKNKDIVEEQLKTIKDIMGAAEVESDYFESLITRSKCYDTLKSLSEETIDQLVEQVFGNDINQLYQINQLYKVVEIIANAALAYADLASCYPGMINRLVQEIPNTLDHNMIEQYNDFLDKEYAEKLAQLTELDIINHNNITAVLCEFIDNFMEKVNNSESLKEDVLNFMINQSRPIELNKIPVEHNKVYEAINSSFLEYFDRIPTFNEYKLIIEDIGANFKLQQYFFGNKVENITKVLRTDLILTSNNNEDNNDDEDDTSLNNIGSLFGDDLSSELTYFTTDPNHNSAKVSLQALLMQEVD